MFSELVVFLLFFSQIGMSVRAKMVEMTAAQTPRASTPRVLTRVLALVDLLEMEECVWVSSCCSSLWFFNQRVDSDEICCCCSAPAVPIITTTSTTLTVSWSPAIGAFAYRVILTAPNSVTFFLHFLIPFSSLPFSFF